MVRGYRCAYARCCLVMLLLLTRDASFAAESARLLPGSALESAYPEPGIPMQADVANLELHIVVVQGEDAVNIVKKKTAVQPVVEVRDKNNLPVAGAYVTFTTPSHGASGIFLNGSRSVTLVTDSAGRAAVTGLQPVDTGSFNISVSASFHGQIAQATISQTNYLTSAATGGSSGASAAAGLSTAALIAIIAGVAAGAAIGIGVGLSHGGGSGAAAVTGSIGAPGTSTVGPPH